jgi:hypothetical protein
MSCWAFGIIRWCVVTKTPISRTLASRHQSCTQNEVILHLFPWFASDTPWPTLMNQAVMSEQKKVLVLCPWLVLGRSIWPGSHLVLHPDLILSARLNQERSHAEYSPLSIWTVKMRVTIASSTILSHPKTIINKAECKVRGEFEIISFTQQTSFLI